MLLITRYTLYNAYIPESCKKLFGSNMSSNIHVMDYDFRMMFRNHVQDMTAELILITDIILAVYEAERGYKDKVRPKAFVE